MSKKKMMMPANGHRIQGMTSEKFLDSKEFLDELNLTGSERTFIKNIQLWRWSCDY